MKALSGLIVCLLEIDDLRIKLPLKARPVYAEACLLDLMNPEVTRKSSRFSNKPAPQHKETRDRKPKGLEVGKDGNETNSPVSPRDPT